VLSIEHFQNVINRFDTNQFKFEKLYGTASTSDIDILERFHDSGRALVRAEYGYPNGSPDTKVKVEIRRYSSQCSARLSAHLNDLVVSFMKQPDNK
jgi:hypothetical protein